MASCKVGTNKDCTSFGTEDLQWVFSQTLWHFLVTLFNLKSAKVCIWSPAVLQTLYESSQLIQHDGHMCPVWLPSAPHIFELMEMHLSAPLALGIFHCAIYLDVVAFGPSQG